MRKRFKSFCLAVMLLLALCPSALAMEESPVLDAGLSLLEEGNPFLEQYNRETGKHIDARFPLGCPYFFGGSKFESIGMTREAWQSSKYYKEGTTYVAGFDCVGFTRWVFKQAGWREHPSLSNLISPYKSSNYFITATYSVPDDLVSQYLQPGDLLVLQHASGGYHVMIYIGTLRSFGWTAETLPAALAGDLDYPLVLHCSSNEDYYDRYLAYVREYKPWAQPTDGGVMVSLLNAPTDGCDGVMRNEDGSTLSYYKFFGYNLTVYLTDDVKTMQWVRWR